MNAQEYLLESRATVTSRFVRNFLAAVLIVGMSIGILLSIVRLFFCIPVWMEEGPREEFPDPYHYAGEPRIVDFGDGSCLRFRWIPAGSVFFGNKARFFTGAESNFGKRARVEHGFWLCEVPQAEVPGKGVLVSSSLGYLYRQTGLRFRFATAEEIAYAGASCDPAFCFKYCKELTVGQKAPNAWGLLDLETDFGWWYNSSFNNASSQFRRLVLPHDPADDPRHAEPPAVTVAVPVKTTGAPAVPSGPVWRISAEKGGIVRDGATLEIDGQKWTLPVELTLVRGAMVGPGKVTLETENRTFSGNLSKVQVDWSGVRETMVELR